MLLPYNVDVAMSRLPWANWGLIGITTIISVVILATPTPPPPEDPEYEELRREHRTVEYVPPAPPALALQHKPFHFWQLLTYVLVHGGLLHLLGNMIFLFCFGNAIDARLGHGPFLAAYFVLGMAGGLAWLAFGGGDALVGASGAIMGIAGLFLVLYPRNDVVIFYLWVGGVGSFRLSSYWVVLANMVVDLWGTFGETDKGVAYICHLGGELLGVGLGVGLLLSGFMKPARGEENLLQILGFQKPAPKRKGL